MSILLSVFGVAEENKYTVNDVKNKSVLVQSPSGGGTGFVVSRKDKNGKQINLILTAGHVVWNSMSKGTRTSNLNQKSTIVQRITVKNWSLSMSEFMGKVIKYSDSDHYDIAVIVPLIPVDIFGEGVEFERNIPDLGDRTILIGNFLGMEHDLISTFGYYAGYDLYVPGVDSPFDIANITLSPGCSGGGVFLQSNKKCLGIIVRGSEKINNIGLFKTVRVLEKWAKGNSIEWVFDPNKTVPTFEELISIDKVDTDPKK
jgi:hypothetical protein